MRTFLFLIGLHVLICSIALLATGTDHPVAAIIAGIVAIGMMSLPQSEAEKNMSVKGEDLGGFGSQNNGM